MLERIVASQRRVTEEASGIHEVTLPGRVGTCPDRLCSQDIYRTATSAPTILNADHADDSRIAPRGGPWGDRGPTREPMGADPISNPIPEPGTLTLASLGLLALGAAMRKRRTANAARPAGRG